MPTIHCPNCGEIIRMTGSTGRHPNGRKLSTPSHSEPNDRDFAHHLRRVRMIEDKIISPGFSPDLLEDL